MGSKELLNKVLALDPQERFVIIEGLLASLDEPNQTIDNIWANEAQKRLKAYREGRLEAVPMEEIFTE
ncbi:MAG: addiction module protein [Algicola sp.]|nr:addiction module protein [Algicola sp.]